MKKKMEEQVESLMNEWIVNRDTPDGIKYPIIQNREALSIQRAVKSLLEESGMTPDMFEDEGVLQEILEYKSLD